MSQTARNVAFFQTTLPSKADPDHVNRLPGRNVAEWLAAEVRRLGHDAGTVGEEDFGWFLPVTLHGRLYNLLLSPVANAGEDACDGYVCSLELRSVTGRFLAWLADRTHAEPVSVLEQILSEARHVKAVRWFARLRDVQV